MTSKFVIGVICLKRARKSKNYAKSVRVGNSAGVTSLNQLATRFGTNVPVHVGGRFGNVPLYVTSADM